ERRYVASGPRSRSPHLPSAGGQGLVAPSFTSSNPSRSSKGSSPSSRRRAGPGRLPRCGCYRRYGRVSVLGWIHKSSCRRSSPIRLTSKAAVYNPAVPDARPRFTLITAARLVDGTGGAGIEPGALLVVDDRVFAAGPLSDVRVPDGAVAE